MEIRFKEIKFGFADASVEAQHEPDLLTDAFYDATELADSIWKSGRRRCQWVVAMSSLNASVGVR